MSLRAERTSVDRRVERSREAVLDATFDLLAERGAAGLTVDAVVERSGVAKTTVYRHWDSRASLLADVFERMVEPAETPSSGCTSDDLTTILCRVRDTLWGTRVGDVLPAFLDAAERDAEVRTLRDRLADERRKPMRTVLELGVARGEFPGGLDVDLTADRLIGPVFFRRLMTPRSLTDAEIAAHLDATLAGLTV